jgi:hypothetical protein
MLAAAVPSCASYSMEHVPHCRRANHHTLIVMPQYNIRITE